MNFINKLISNVEKRKNDEIQKDIIEINNHETNIDIKEFEEYNEFEITTDNNKTLPYIQILPSKAEMLGYLKVVLGELIVLNESEPEYADYVFDSNEMHKNDFLMDIESKDISVDYSNKDTIVISYKNISLIITYLKDSIEIETLINIDDYIKSKITVFGINIDRVYLILK